MAARRVSVGRPRKWASEAERKQAYRQRLAADLEDQLTLRRDLRTERRRTAGLKQENDRLRARLAVAERRTESAEEPALAAKERKAWLNEDADRDRRQLFEAREALVELQAEIGSSALLPLAPPRLRPTGLLTCRTEPAARRRKLPGPVPSGAASPQVARSRQRAGSRVHAASSETPASLTLVPTGSRIDGGSFASTDV